MHNRRGWILVALSGFVVVVAGAFGAHALEGRLAPRMLEAFDTGVRYQAWHTLAAMAMLIWRAQRPLRGQTTVLWLWSLGMAAFSGSLYLLALTGTPWLGPITPFGGLLLMAGWLTLAICAWRQRPAH
ncbi:uncharacterized membrane protein YgdD (TMEM256/DUF423 family) [Chromohalobacter marismortui]|uniref:Uncharacterized membrane protein YgdD (TMEM256/DUF423 family) n=1 Tax=Chromohalobacter marismortui TaxID=42055 RepID=A0A4R7NDC6_9GAMM|nr:MULTISPECIES: DUF423 domain-containing protein [Chromohalobacter]MCI0509909.1 DUF423 domain-containing protein [Chromohalobacter sp.]MCI0592060.1 DUF423 domain-containing protein [Chromohalobacter sp.]TDU18198.1 uncharacterized membrane protein YgdD (TMEM256/DUF423 family) [Chromohalobacter marismortui]